jgi:selenocysteine lyase/cysteine desulfurase
VADRGDWDQVELVWAPDARRYEGGTVNTVGIMGLGASAALLQAAGIDAVWAHVDGLCERLRSGLREAGARVLSTDDPAGRSGIVSFMVDGWRPTPLAERLVADGFAVVPRADAVRAAPHGYNSADEVDALVAAVANGNSSVL